MLWAFTSLDDVRLFLPDGEDVDVARFAGIVSDFELYVETPAGVVSFNAILPDDAIAADLVPADIMLLAAELIAPAMAADADE